MTKEPAPRWPVTFGYDTATALHHLMTAQKTNAEYWAEEGLPQLLEHWKTLEPFYNSLTEYVTKYS